MRIDVRQFCMQDAACESCHFWKSRVRAARGRGSEFAQPPCPRPPSVDLVRDGQVAVETAGQSYEWYGFAVMDSLNRIFAGEPVIDQGLGWLPVDAEHNLPTSPGSPVEDTFDVEDTYAKIWR